VLGAGPAALSIGSELGARGLRVAALAPVDPTAPWTNTYGIWAEEVDALGLGHLLSHRWSDCVSFFCAGDGSGSGSGNSSNNSAAASESQPYDRPLQHGRAYGLFDKAALQAHWLGRCASAGVVWQQGKASTIRHTQAGSTLTTCGGQELTAQLVVDASGHDPVFVRRRNDGPVAGQAAYGMVGRFSAAPISPGQFVFMDYRCDHLSAAERLQPPTFLYAMDLGDGVFFVEETSLALAPAVPFAQLQDRLRRRLAHRGVELRELMHEEFCLFPMNPALPDLNQRVVGFGGAASMVHPASGYLVGGLLRRAPELASAVEAALEQGLQGEALARAAWQGVWPADLRWKHGFFRFGLEKLMRFDGPQLRHHFASFFSLPPQQWYGFLTNTITPAQLLAAMLRLYGQAPWDVRWGLMGQRGRELSLLARWLLG